MNRMDKDRALASLLWGGVAAVGQYTMLFLSVVERIRVGFANELPVFSVDPRGPINLTKDSALSAVWALTLVVGLVVAELFYFRPQVSRRAWMVIAPCAVLVAAVAALAEPLWGLVIVVDVLLLYFLLRPGANA